MSNFPETITLDFQEALNQFDCIKGVIYKANDYDETEPVSSDNPIAYLCCFTLAECWLVDALPLDENLEVLDGYIAGIPTHTKYFGEAIGYAGE